MTNFKVEDFLNDVKDHKMEILLDHGVYRDIKFKNPKDSNRWSNKIVDK